MDVIRENDYIHGFTCGGGRLVSFIFVAEEVFRFDFHGAMKRPSVCILGSLKGKKKPPTA